MREGRRERDVVLCRFVGFGRVGVSLDVEGLVVGKKWNLGRRRERFEGDGVGREEGRREVSSVVG